MLPVTKRDHAGWRPVDLMLGLRAKELNMDRLIELMNELQDAEVELEEANECGTLEERLEAAQKVADLRIAHTEAVMRETGGL